jgi:hypothetical protein
MTPQDQAEPLAINTLVHVRNSGFGRGRIAEYRGPLGPKGARVYRVQYRRKPPAYIEVLEEQLEVLPPEGESPAGPAATS